MPAPSDSQDHRAMGGQALAEGRLDQAETHLLQALHERPFDEECHCELGFVYWKEKRVEEALRHLTQALELNPNNQAVIFRCVEVFSSLGRQQDAIEILDAYLNRIPWDEEAKGKLERLRSTGNPPMGHAFDPAQFFVTQGEEQFAKGRQERARVCFELALEHDASHPTAHNNLAVLAFEEQRFQDALEHLEKALDGDSEDPEILRNCVNVLAGTGDFETALDCLEAYLQRKPQDLEAWQEYRSLARASASLWKGERVPREVSSVYRRFGEELLAQDDWIGGIEALQRAVVIDPQDPSLYENLGRCHRDVGQLDDAIACFREALDRNPRNRDAVRTLAECLVETGERGKAVEVLNAFLEKEPLDKDLTALLESLGPEKLAVNTAS